VPEGDSVFVAARRLRAALAGQTLTRSDFRVPRLATVDLQGQRVSDVYSHGKHLFFSLDHRLTLHSHFRMEGEWHIYQRGERWRGPGWEVRAVLETAERQVVGFRLPVLELLSDHELVALRARLGPDPLRDDWDAAEALRRLTAAPNRTVGELLLDQSIIAGPGNVYRCELCFLRGLHPDTRIGEIADPAALVSLVKRVFDANREHAGHVTTGNTRRGQRQWVYGRAGLPCRRCGTPIRRRAATPGPDGERVLYWCPHCQPAAASGGSPAV
jgi:endonuclease-8